jgi:peptidyl-prolyl cis-trans isomerase C
LAFARTLFREPFVYFVLCGVLVFAIDSAVRRNESTIFIRPEDRTAVARSFEARVGRAPVTTELEAELGSWKEQQALYREAVRLGLRDDDPVVIGHVGGKLLNIARERSVFPEPTEKELRDFLDRNRSRFSVPATYSFDQVFVSRTHDDVQERASQLLAELRTGTSPDGLGDWFPRGTRFRDQTANDVGLLLGDEAARNIAGYAVGEWNLAQGPQGLHAIRVTAADRGEPAFDDLRPTLVLAYDAERREDAARAYAREVTRHYRFVESR